MTTFFGLEKQCCACKEILSTDDFANNRTNADGKNDICRQCKGKQKSKLQYEKNREKVIAYQKRYAETHKEKVKGWRREAKRRRSAGEQEAHNERKRELARKRYAANLEKFRLKCREDAKKLNQRHPTRRKSMHLKHKYGILLDEYNRILSLQNGVCAICKQPSSGMDKRTGKPKMLAVDHNHKTGAVRGLLCSRCNFGLGYFQDNSIYLTSAVEYINKFSAVEAATNVQNPVL